MDVDNTPDEVTGNGLVGANGNDIAEQLLALDPRPIIVSLVDRNSKSGFAACKKPIYSRLSCFHARPLNCRLFPTFKAAPALCHVP